DRVSKEKALRLEQRDAVLVPRVRVAAHRDDGGEVVQIEVVELLVPGPEAPVGQTRGVEPLAEQPEAPEGVLLLDDEDRLHRADASRDSRIESKRRSRGGRSFSWLLQRRRRVRESAPRRSRRPSPSRPSRPSSRAAPAASRSAPS